ncbi:MAG: TIGR02147 family protein [Fibrobacterota bacterium]|nr:TIGR02147 family protein [Fibrobacterota bacterium]
MDTPLKSIFDYTDYRRYLREYYAWAKTNKHGFSHRAFMAKTGMSGPNYFKRVMEGVHNLTENSIPKFASALDLTDSEANYFKYLVYFNQAGTLDEKDRCFGILMDLKTPHAHYVLEKAQYDYYKDWYNIAIREMLSFFPYKDNAKEMAKRLAPEVSPKKVKQSIELLEGLGLIEKAEDGTYRAASKFILTDPDVQSLFIPKFHQAMTRLAADAITRFPKDERYFSSSTVSLSERTYKEIIELIRSTRKDVLRKVGEDQEPERVYHLNMQLFPLTAVASKKKKRKS